MNFELRQETVLQKCSRRTVGAVILLLSIFGGSSLGVLSNIVMPRGSSKYHKDLHHTGNGINKSCTFLINAWRFQALFVIFLVLAPAICLYERYIKQYDEYGARLKMLR